MAYPEVFSHNIETVERLTGRVRDPRADYRQSLSVLEATFKHDNRRVLEGQISMSAEMLTVTVYLPVIIYKSLRIHFLGHW